MTSALNASNKKMSKSAINFPQYKPSYSITLLFIALAYSIRDRVACKHMCMGVRGGLVACKHMCTGVRGGWLHASICARE